MKSDATPIVYVVTLNWNRRDDTLACIESLSQMEYPNFHIVVVDNGSTDDSVSAIQAHFPAVKVISNPANLGFAGGMNLGIEFALLHGADYVFIMNNDTVVDRQLLSELVKEAERSPEIGIVGPKIYYYDAPDTVWFAGGDRDRWTQAVTRMPRGRDDKRVNVPRAVNFLCGCGMLVRRNVLEQVGLFDPGYFMYYEDADYCIRVEQAGFNLYYVPTARMWHKAGASSGGEGSPVFLYYRRRALLRFLRHHVRGVQRPVLLFLRSGGILAEMLVELIRGRRDVARWLWRGLWEGMSEQV
jgi:GT2 family glycosyltransferase